MVVEVRGVALVVIGLALAACQADARVEICGRGDRAELAAALRGGSLDLTYRDAGGAVVGQVLDVAVDRATALSTSIPDEAAEVEVTGRAADGSPVAVGRAAVGGDGTCVCLALTGQHAAACQAIGCRVEGDRCAFFEADGSPAGSRTLVFGDNGDDGVTGVVADTYLSAATGELDATFGGEPVVRIAADPVATGLVRVDLSGLPRASVIERAELELTPCPGAGCAASGALAAFAVLERWDEGAAAGAACASWNCRTDAVAWSVPGCGFISEQDRSREAAALATATAEPGEPFVLDVTDAVTAWAADPAKNLGLALAVDEDGAITVASSEAPAGGGARPRLRVVFRLPDEVAPPDGGPVGPPDGGVDPVLPEMVPVPAGAFVMGCDPNVVAECEADEQPVHAVSLAAFEIDTTEVTQAAYAACLAAGDCSAVPTCDWDPVDRARYPVTCVTHGQARTYCAAVGKRLPTEAEWEKAARGTDGRRWPWGDALPSCARANKFGCVGATTPVGIRPDGASFYGALDMGGNASEWVADFYQADYYAVSPASDPTGPATGTTRVRRGGAYAGGDAALETFERTSTGGNQAKPNIGFRCARSL
jgi:formylglycine-generating enzyme required for sulfatase activity